jgi:DNA repair photolyase
MYCGFGGLLISMVNVEDYCRHLGQIIERHPWQKTYLLDDDADPLCLEPEHGCLGPLIAFFGAAEDRYLVIHTKSWNTDWMANLKHGGKTIIVWSVAGPTQSRLIEPKAGTTDQRIAAARSAAEAGYPIRYKFKPIIPVVGWREEAAQAVDMVFAQTKPDIISLCVFMWQDVDEMVKRLGEDLIDPVCLQAARAERDSVEDTRTKPFPARIRAEIYDHYLSEIRKHDADIPVSLSTENFAMWKAFAPKLGMTATNYVCGCGPQAIPNAKTLADHPFQVAVRDDAGIPGVIVGV